MLKYLLIFSLLASGTGWTWSANGHKVIGQIAYDHLSPLAKKKFLHLNQCLNHNHKYNTLASAAVWLDVLYDPKYVALKPMHYIDIPYSTDNMSLGRIAPVNAVSALEEACKNINAAAFSETDRAFALRVILHVVGDIHQPLHTITRVSYAHPQGDRGGNDFHLGKNRIGNNLHRYWDKGGGLLTGKIRSQEIKKLAKRWSQQIVCPKEDLEIMHWVNDAHKIAIQQTYVIQEYSIPTPTYEENTQQISKQQLVYAGCRLASLLNKLAPS